jgi:hypothetical protein
MLLESREALHHGHGPSKRVREMQQQNRVDEDRQR